MLVVIATMTLVGLSPFIVYIIIEFVDWKKYPGSHRFYRKLGKHHEKS